MDKNEAILKEILLEIVDKSEIQLDHTLKDLGFDSLQIVILLAKIESRFNIEINEEDLDIKNFNTVRSILNMVNRLKTD